MTPPVNITIVTYNRVAYTKMCLAALFANTDYPFLLNIIDNGSSDETPTYLRELRADSRYAQHIHNVVILEKNMGISCAYNLGWALLDADYYVKVDNDVIFLRSDWLTRLVAYAEKLDSAAMLGFGRNTSGFRHPEYPDLYVQGHLGGCALITRAVHEKIGFWNEDYGLYGEEDADFGLRARLAGYFNFSLDDGGGAFLKYADTHEESSYAAWKGDCRRTNIQSTFLENDFLFKCGFRDIYVERMYLPYSHENTYRFRINADYVRRRQLAIQTYMPLREQIIASDEFKKINTELGFGFYY